jgi:hypothetical protein
LDVEIKNMKNIIFWCLKFIAIFLLILSSFYFLLFLYAGLQDIYIVAIKKSHIVNIVFGHELFDWTSVAFNILVSIISLTIAFSQYKIIVYLRGKTSNQLPSGNPASPSS